MICDVIGRFCERSSAIFNISQNVLKSTDESVESILDKNSNNGKDKETYADYAYKENVKQAMADAARKARENADDKLSKGEVERLVRKAVDDVAKASSGRYTGELTAPGNNQNQNQNQNSGKKKKKK